MGFYYIIKKHHDLCQFRWAKALEESNKAVGTCIHSRNWHLGMALWYHEHNNGQTWLTSLNYRCSFQGLIIENTESNHSYYGIIRHIGSQTPQVPPYLIESGENSIEAKTREEPCEQTKGSNSSPDNAVFLTISKNKEWPNSGKKGPKIHKATDLSVK